MKHFLCFFFLAFGFSECQNMKCNYKVLTAYGFEEMSTPTEQKMLLCEGVDWTCCSHLEEVKFLKKWVTYYEKLHKKQFENLMNLFDKLDDSLTYFLSFSVENNKALFPINNLPTANVLMTNLKDLGFTSFADVKKELDDIKSTDLFYKQNFVCGICDAKNSLKMNRLNKSFYVSKTGKG